MLLQLHNLKNFLQHKRAVRESPVATPYMYGLLMALIEKERTQDPRLKRMTSWRNDLPNVSHTTMLRMLNVLNMHPYSKKKVSTHINCVVLYKIKIIKSFGQKIPNSKFPGVLPKLSLASNELKHLVTILHDFARGLIIMDGNTFTLSIILITKSLQKRSVNLESKF